MNDINYNLLCRYTDKLIEKGLSLQQKNTYQDAINGSYIIHIANESLTGVHTPEILVQIITGIFNSKETDLGIEFLLSLEQPLDVAFAYAQTQEDYWEHPERMNSYYSSPLRFKGMELEYKNKILVGHKNTLYNWTSSYNVAETTFNHILNKIDYWNEHTSLELAKYKKKMQIKLAGIKDDEYINPLCLAC